MKQPIKIVIPMAGLGTRLRPLTWSIPKQLLNVAGKSVLDHVLNTFNTLPDPTNFELINIVGYLGDQIEAHIKNNYPHITSHYVVQEDPRGQSHAIYLARQYIKGPMLVVFADTLIETDLSFLANNSVEAVAWVKPVPDPRRFGVAELGNNGYVKRLIEKPDNMQNNLALVGFYYFEDGEALISAIKEQMDRNIQTKGEFFLADAINIMLEHGLRMNTNAVDVWLDTGTPEALLETNCYLLEHGMDNSLEASKRKGIVVIPPVYIHPSAQVDNSVIGPFTSLGADCSVQSSIIRNTILGDAAEVTDVVLEGSLVGRRAKITRRPGRINAGDQTMVIL